MANGGGYVDWFGIPGMNSGKTGGYAVHCDEMADKGMVQHDIWGHVHRSWKDKAGDQQGK